MNVKLRNELKELNALYREMDGLYHELALKAGLSDSAFFILYAIAEFGDGCLQKDIAEQYFINKKTINSSIKKLEAQGYLKLQRGKRRDMHLYLTEAGRKLQESKIVPVFELENSILDEMPVEESQQLLRLMKKYAAIYSKKIAETFSVSSEDL